MDHKYITQVDGVCGGREIIKGTRLEVEWIALMLANANSTLVDTYEELQEDYNLSMEQINEVERYYFCA